MRFKATLKQKLNGFTLIEIMVVIVLIGLMASVVQFNFTGNTPEKLIEKESQRFSAIFNIAAEYSMLNSVELGLVIEENTYQFLGFDGKVWVPISENKLLAPYTVPESFALELTLDGLPLDEPPLIDVLKETQESDLTFSGSELEDEKKLTPQVYILSGGDLTPFTLRFELAENYDVEAPVSYAVSGLYNTPLTIEGPLFDE